jgi:hypothetical protein
MQGSLIVLPYAAIYIASEVGALSLDVNKLWIIAAVILIADVVMLFMSTKIFQREEILTRWT